MDELTREFLIESREGLDRMERCLTDLEERPYDAVLLADAFRSVHAIKGTTGFLGLKRLEKLTQTGGNLLGMLRYGKLAANALLVTGLLQLLDGLRSILKTIEADGNEAEGSDTEIIVNLEELQAPAFETTAKQSARASGAKARASQQPAIPAPPADAPPRRLPPIPGRFPPRPRRPPKLQTVESTRARTAPFNPRRDCSIQPAPGLLHPLRLPRARCASM